MVVSFIPMLLVGWTAKDIWTPRVGELIFFVMVGFIVALWNLSEDMNKWKDEKLNLLEEEKEMYKKVCYKFIEREEKDKYGF